MAILEIFSVIGAPVVGIVGGFLQRRHERKMYSNETERLKINHAHELKLTELNMVARREEVEQEIALTEVQGDFDILEAGINAEASLSNVKYGQSTLGDIANFARAMIRPLTTLYLLIAVSVYAAHELLTGGITEDNRLLLVAMVDAFLMTLAFWFASRAGSYRTSYKDGTYSRG